MFEVLFFLRKKYFCYIIILMIMITIIIIIKIFAIDN